MRPKRLHTALPIGQSTRVTQSGSLRWPPAWIATRRQLNGFSGRFHCFALLGHVQLQCPGATAPGRCHYQAKH